MPLKFIPSLYERPICVRLKDGISVPLYEFMSIYIYVEIFGGKCYDITLSGTRSPKILDIGANTGMFALRMKQFYFDSQSVYFEPFTMNFKRLTETLAMNSLDGVNAVRSGVAATSRKDRLYIHPRNVGGHSLIQSVAGQRGKNASFVDIELVDLGAALDAIVGGHCDLVKMDREGAEYDIIKSITPVLAERTGYIRRCSTRNAFKRSDINGESNKASQWFDGSIVNYFLHFLAI